MSRTSPAPASGSADAKPKRQPGIKITVTGFVPANPSDFARYRKVLDAMDAAINKGDLTAVMAMMQDTAVKHAMTSRVQPPASDA